MLQLLVTYKFENKDVRDQFYSEIKLNNIQKLCESETGCLRYEYFYPCNESDTLFLVEQWESADNQQAHLKHPDFILLGKLKEKYHVSTSIELWDCSKH